MLAVQVDYWKLQEQKRHNLAEEAIGSRNASANMYGAAASLYGASANLQNADSNRRNAATNERNAEINAENAQSNRISALANQRNAETNWQNALTNQRNAAVNERQAAVSEKLATYQTEGIGALKDQNQALLNYSLANKAVADEALSKATTQLRKQETKTEEQRTWLTREQANKTEIEGDIAYTDWYYRGAQDLVGVLKDAAATGKTIGEAIGDWESIFQHVVQGG